MANHLLRKTCTHEGCKEYSITEYSNRKEYNEAVKRNQKFTCLRHSKINEVIGLENAKTEQTLICKKTEYGLFWYNIENADNQLGGQGFVHGNGYKAWAKDFPEGTILKVTAEIILP